MIALVFRSLTIHVFSHVLEIYYAPSFSLFLYDIGVTLIYLTTIKITFIYLISTGEHVLISVTRLVPDFRRKLY